MDTSWASLNHVGEELCGDKVEIIKQDENGVLLVLSDGLGSGVKANILATLTCKILSTMVAAGTDIRDVVETVASTLPVDKERGVAYSTFTLMQVDGEGNAYFVEFDNPSLILLREGRHIGLPWHNLDIAGKQIREARMKLTLGDMAVTFSDGIIHAGIGHKIDMGWQQENVIDYLETNWSALSRAADVQHRLLEKTFELYDGEPGDDCTVAALHVIRPMPCCVMVGPPVSPADDGSVVDDLMSCEGRRVICGGTTSQIVSSYLGREVTIDLDYISPDVPPIAHMEGVDLITEGVVTIGKVLELLERYAEAQDPAVLHRDCSGASLLAAMLVEECTSVRFLVGRALNPAHQNPDMPISLSIKLRLVKDIADCLEKLGKPVSLRYC